MASSSDLVLESVFLVKDLFVLGVQYYYDYCARRTLAKESLLNLCLPARSPRVPTITSAAPKFVLVLFGSSARSLLQSVLLCKITAIKIFCAAGDGTPDKVARLQSDDAH